jgi:hypothetical protein
MVEIPPLVFPLGAERLVVHPGCGLEPAPAPVLLTHRVPQLEELVVTEPLMRLDGQGTTVLEIGAVVKPRPELR